MGIEVASPDVEESTEPPICGSNEEQSLSTTTKYRAHLLGVGDQEKVPTVTSVQPPLATDERVETPGTTLDRWNEQYTYAHTLSVAQVSQILGVDLNHGLSSTEAESRLQRDGPNKVKGTEGVSMWEILLRQVSNSLTLVLLITMGLSFGIADYIEGGVISAVIVLNIVVGFVQDYRAEQTIHSLQQLSAPTCKIIRDGKLSSAKAESLVKGDVVQLAVGDVIPADLRLFEGMNTTTDEALLTGESLPAVKKPYDVFSSRDMPIGDRANMAYSGSTMAQGRARGIVIATGMMTEVGKIANLLRDEGSYSSSSNAILRVWFRFRAKLLEVLGLVGTPLQVKLSIFALLLFALAIFLVIIVFSVALWDLQGEVIIYGISVGVAVIPESLIAVLTITIAVGTKAMAKGNVIVRKLQSLEAVGGVTNICSDKTGTLTQGRMVVRSAWVPNAGLLTVHDTSHPFDPRSGTVKVNGEIIRGAQKDTVSQWTSFLTGLALCNLSSVFVDDDHQSSEKTVSGWAAIGEPTEIALQVLAMRFDHGKATLLEDGNLQLVAEHPFDSGIKRMIVVYHNKRENTHEVYAKGATEVLLSIVAMDQSAKTEVHDRAERMAAEGLRVLCIAKKTLAAEDSDQLKERDKAEAGLEFVGLVGIYDPPRPETADAVLKCQMAGITVHMLTGDHIRTATAIAYEVGILGSYMRSVRPSTAIMAATDFDKLSDAEIDDMETLPLVIARCSPSTKVRMVEAMHRRTAFCVMTGDGVNDSPALHRADVGIAMGKAGSDVAKEASDMVLADDDFSSIVKAVEEGRRLFDNIQKFLLHLLISNIAQVILLLIALAFKDDHGNSVFPLSPLEILWTNLITSSFLAIGLGLEEAQPDIMYRPPHDLKTGVFTRELITDKMIYGTAMGSLCLVAFVSVAYGSGNGHLGSECNQGFNSSCDIVFRARATTYATLTFLLLVTAWEMKHFSRSLFRLDPIRYPGPLSIFPVLWRNRFLFWAVFAGFVVAFPVVYLPVVNQVVFKHHGITWEWGIVFGCVAVYLMLVESWKAVKRAFGIGSGKNRILTIDDAEMRVGLSPSTAECSSLSPSVETK